MAEDGFSGPACAFCGNAKEQGALLKSELPGSNVHICEECAVACATALGTERRLTEGRASARPSPPDSDRYLGEVHPWSAFELDGKQLEWRAERVFSIWETQALRLEVRRKDGTALASAEVDERGEIGPAHAEHLVAQARGAGLKTTVATHAVARPSDWQNFTVGSETYQYRTVPTTHRGLSRRLKVTVRDPKSASDATMEFHGDATPTVDDAVLTAASLGAPPKAVVYEPA